MASIRQNSGTSFSFFRFAKECAAVEAKDKNFAFSPCSIHLALSLLANGSTGSTKEELLAFLEAENLDDLNSSNERLINFFRKTKKGDPTLNIVGGVWVDHSISLKPSFQDNARQIYKAKVETVDFQNEVKAKEAIEKVNQWAEKATNGLIKSLFPKGFDSSRKLLLGNAIYFRGRWAEEFGKVLTRDSKFYLLDGKSVEAPFMCSHINRCIATFNDFKILHLPYASPSWEKRISMYIILPKERDGLWPLVENLGSDPLFIDRYVRPYIEEVELGEFMVPKFKIKYGMEASEVLQSIGLNLPFGDDAEFDEMVNCGGSLSVSEVHHQSHIEIDEEGTEAGAATIIDMEEGCCAEEEPLPRVDFVADHPFVFMVRDDRSGVVLFMGHVVDPSLE